MMVTICLQSNPECVCFSSIYLYSLELQRTFGNCDLVLAWDQNHQMKPMRKHANGQGEYLLHIHSNHDVYHEPISTMPVPYGSRRGMQNCLEMQTLRLVFQPHRSLT